MSGICGWFGRSPGEPNSETLIASMSAQLTSPAHEARIASGSTSLCALSTVDSVSNGGLFRHGDCLVAYHGYPEVDTSTNVRKQSCDEIARNIFNLYRQFGSNALDYIHGPFVLAILDPSEQRAVLAVDRLGINSLAYAKVGDKLIFGSDMRSILQCSSFRPALCLQSVFNYLYFHVVPAPDSIYTEIHKLLPAECVLYEGGRLRTHTYWRIRYQEDIPSDRRQLGKQLRDCLRGAVERNAVDERTGTFLSGGLDSTTVTGIYSELSSHRTDAYAIGFDADGYDEIPYARLSAQHFDVRLHEKYVTPNDLADSISLVVAGFDEPFGNASALPVYFCAREAKENGTRLLLAGDGGDEIFAGNARYAKQKIFDHYESIPRWFRSLILEPSVDLLAPENRPMGWRKICSYVEQAKIPMPERLESYNFLTRADLPSILTADFLATVDTSEPLRRLSERYSSANYASPLKRMLNLDMQFTLSDNDLRKVNRMCTLAGLDVRYPMLDEALVAFSAKLPSQLLLKNLQLRYLFKKALRDFLPSATMTKEKHGFGLPFGVWMKENEKLQSIAYDSINDLKNYDYLSPSYLDRLVGQHRSGHASYYGVMIWVLMVLSHWLRESEAIKKVI